VLARSSKTTAQLGFPVGVARTAKHVRDGFENAEYDEVAELNAAGRVIALTQFDASGALRLAARLDNPRLTGPKITDEQAARAAQRSALAAGLAVGQPTATEADTATGGWIAHWARFSNGIPVRGDETRVLIWPDGRTQSVARVEHNLAPAPAQPLARDKASEVATRNLDHWFAGRKSGYAMAGLSLEWVEPNAAFDPSRLGATSSSYRLAWVVQAKPAGDAAAYMWLMTLYIDASNGSLIGGDFVE
jgi:hypothetical protein